jgi:hypothetical protein
MNDWEVSTTARELEQGTPHGDPLVSSRSDANAVADQPRRDPFLDRV